MDLWDMTDAAVANGEYQNDAENPYLASPEKSLELIARLLPKVQLDEASKKLRKIERMLSGERLLSALRNTSGSVGRLARLSEKIAEYKKIEMLAGKNIMGVGGKFSAGKSCFINSLLGVGEYKILPEDVDTTTSIPTYILGGVADEEIYAYLGRETVKLDLEALQAMTHQFFNRYGIGFSRFVKNIVLRTPDFPPNLSGTLALLDTPGYNKSSRNTKADLTDEFTAEQQLKAVDFLIWLTDIDGGTIHEEDIKFIGRLSLSETPVLLVFNKADKKTESECRSIVEESRDILKKRGINIYGVTAYSSRDRREYDEKNLVHEFLEYSAKPKAKKGLGDELEDIICEIDAELEKEGKASEVRRNGLGDAICRSEDILDIKSMADFYSKACQMKRQLDMDRENFQAIAKEIRGQFAELGGIGKVKYDNE